LRLLARHAREHGPAEGHLCLGTLAQLVDAAYPTHTAIKLIIDNHSAHISKQTKGLARQTASWPLRIHFHAETRLLAQSHRGFFLETRPIGVAPYPCHNEARAQGSHHGRHG
jgi:hypothetical protein